MKTVKHVKFHSAISEGTISGTMNALRSFCTPVISDDYEYFFANEMVYYNRQAMREVLESNPDSIRIMICGEALYPDMNLFDYALWFNGHYECDDRVLSSPMLHALKGVLFELDEEFDKSKNGISSEQILSEKTKFCNFMYSNPNAHPMRDQMFYSLSEYKKVDSLGMHLKNVEIDDSRYDEDWYKKSVDMKHPYKFSIAAENAAFPGYTTEKLMTSMMANTIPLYFGNPYVSDLYNAKSFIDVNSFADITSFVKYVAEVDNDDALYCSIMDEPWRTKEQIDKYQKDIDAYENGFERIFTQEYGLAKRRPRGTWPDMVYPTIFRYQEEIKSHRFRGYIKKTADRLLQVMKGRS